MAQPLSLAPDKQTETWHLDLLMLSGDRSTLIRLQTDAQSCALTDSTAHQSMVKLLLLALASAIVASVRRKFPLCTAVSNKVACPFGTRATDNTANWNCSSDGTHASCHTNHVCEDLSRQAGLAITAYHCSPSEVKIRHNLAHKTCCRDSRTCWATRADQRQALTTQRLNETQIFVGF